MSKVFNWVFGSFFRTLGRVLCFIVIGIIIVFMFEKLPLTLPKLPIISDLLAFDVYASNYQMGDVITNTTFEINNVAITTTNKRFISANNNVNFHLYSSAVWSPFDNDVDYQYGYLSFCASSDFNPNNFTAGYYSKNARIFNSYQKCQVANSNYNDAYTYYITWQINIDRACTAGATSTYCDLDNNFDFTIDKDMDFSLIDFGLSDNQINVDTSTGAIMYNQNIISQRQITAIDAVTSATNNNTEERRQQVNDIIDNQNDNTQDIIDNQNANSQAQIDSQKVCQDYDSSSIDENYNKGWLNSSGNYYTSNSTQNYGVSEYINIYRSEVTILKTGLNTMYACIYNVDKVKISCINGSDLIENTNLQLPTGSYYIRISIQKTTNKPTIKVCKNGNQALTDTFTDSNSTQATNEASSFFDNFTTDTHGLTGIITAPLNAINSLTSSSCSPLVLPLPFVNENLTLPCMRDIYEVNFGSFMALYDIITLGIISYWVMVRIFGLVKDFKNPEHDEIEVLDL